MIAKPDERWAERPLCCVVLREGSDTGADELVEHLRGRVAKWWLPDEFAFVAEIPKTSVGKFDKKVLRGQAGRGTARGPRERLLSTFLPVCAVLKPKIRAVSPPVTTPGDTPRVANRQAMVREWRTKDDV